MPQNPMMDRGHTVLCRGLCTCPVTSKVTLTPVTYTEVDYGDVSKLHPVHFGWIETKTDSLLNLLLSVSTH